MSNCPTICFVLSAPELGQYADMAAVAALSVRRLHPDARILLLADEATAQAIERTAHRLRGIATEIIPSATGHSDVLGSSRFLKTSMRKRVSGDFLFLDTDVVVVRPLDRDFPADADLAAALDWNAQGIPADATPRLEKLRARFGWQFSPTDYFNSGVLLVRDTPGAHAFFDEWHRRWTLSEANGISLDQPTFNSTLASGLASFSRLPPTDNWVVNSAIPFRGRARIFHFWVSDGMHDHTLISHLTARLRKDGVLDEELLAAAARDNLPWIGDVGPRRLASSGLWFRAARAALRRALQWAFARPHL